MKYSTENWVSWGEGTLPVVICCGHDGGGMPEGVGFRSGVGLWSFSRQQDVQARLIAEGMAEGLERIFGEAPTTIIFEASRKFIDVNRAPGDAYEAPRAVAWPIYRGYHVKINQAARAMKKKGLLLDIHGTSISGADFFLGADYYFSVNSIEPVHTLGRLLATSGHPVILHHRRMSGGFTVRVHGAEQGGLDAIQIEVARPLRSDATLRSAAINHLSAAVAVIVQGYRGGASETTRCQPQTGIA